MPEPAAIDLDRLHLGRLEQVREQLKARDLACCVLVDPVDIRYATGARNMQVFHARNPARYLLVAAEGPLVLFEFISPRACRRSTRSARRSPYPGDVRVVGAVTGHGNSVTTESRHYHLRKAGQAWLTDR